MCDFLRVIAWFCDEKFSLKKSCFYLYIRRHDDTDRATSAVSSRYAAGSKKKEYCTWILPLLCMCMKRKKHIWMVFIVSNIVIWLV